MTFWYRYRLRQAEYVKPDPVKLKPGVIPFKGRYCNLPKAYEYMVKKEIQRMVDIGVLKELLWHDDSP